MASANVVAITEENFQQEVEEFNGLVMVDFWAEWCGPCKMIGPVIDELADEYAGKAKIAKINVDEQGNLAKKFRVMSIPSILFFKDGKEVDRMVGAQEKEKFAAKIDGLL